MICSGKSSYDFFFNYLLPLELSRDTKLMIHRSIFRVRPTIMYGSESWVDWGYLMRDLEVANMNEYE